MAIDLMNELYGENAGADVDAVDKSALGTTLPPGKYLAVLEGVTGRETFGINTDELLFVVADGDYKGRKVKLTIWKGVNETDKDGNQLDAKKIEEMKTETVNHFWHTARVLGIAHKVAQADGKLRYQFMEGKRDFRDAIGSQCVVVTKVKESKGGFFAEVQKFGALTPDDARAKPLGPTPAKGGTTTTTTTNKATGTAASGAPATPVTNGTGAGQPRQDDIADLF
jgi:hypothetical protein